MHCFSVTNIGLAATAWFPYTQRRELTRLKPFKAELLVTYTGNVEPQAAAHR
ncbi:hypothetical protein DPMN_001315 [Dreissena polymorpha]|uniref:Uncharacterized protein n=1 Tax=Dreissena polymorpha TaxID=45954 RepID=A0A9D4MJ43_DREPO|nr:hypothetical protein DPMN_001315 [Dreissena polymorpha]